MVRCQVTRNDAAMPEPRSLPLSRTQARAATEQIMVLSELRKRVGPTARRQTAFSGSPWPGRVAAARGTSRAHCRGGST